MKAVVTFLLMFLSVIIYSQVTDCKYEVDKRDPYTKYRTKTTAYQAIYLSTEIYSLFFKLGEISSDSSSYKYILVVYSTPIKDICFDKNSMLRLLMKDSTIIDIPYSGKLDCAKISVSYGATTTYSNGTLAFDLSDSIIKKLQDQPFINVRLDYIDGYIDYSIEPAIKKTAYSKYYDLSLNPQQYFINFLKCIAN